mgnify:CR=1 FL=1
MPRATCTMRISSGTAFTRSTQTTSRVRLRENSFASTVFADEAGDWMWMGMRLR